MLGGGMEAALRRRPDAFEWLGLLALTAAAAVLVLGAVKAPAIAALLVLAGAVVLVALARTDLAILLVVATAPVEGAFASGPGISVTKLTGGLCIASFALSVVRQRRVLVFELGQALVLGILGLAMVSMLQAQDT